MSKGVTTQTRVDCGSMQRGAPTSTEDSEAGAPMTCNQKERKPQRVAQRRMTVEHAAFLKEQEKEEQKWSMGAKVGFAAAAVASGGATAIAYAMMNSGSGNYQLIIRPSWTDACLRMCQHVCMCA